MNKLQKIREKIIEANPSILDLVFGCKIEVLFDKLENETGYKGIYKLLSNDFETLKVSGNKTGCLILNKLKSDFKIIGRDILLFDIKQCLMYYEYTDKEFLEIAKLWKAPNSLENQSDKLINKLYEYLKNKNS